MMDTLVVQKKNHAFLNIDCDQGISNELSDYFCFFVPGHAFMPSFKNKQWDGKLRLWDSRKNELPVGLFKYLEEFCKSRGYALQVKLNNYYGSPGSSYEVDMSFMKNCIFTSRGENIEHRDFQLDAVHHAIRVKNSLLLSPTASGKSLIIYTMLRHYLENNDKDILIVVPTKSLVAQMYDDFADYSTHDSGFDVEELCHKIYGGKEKNSKKRIFISTWQSIFSLQTPWFARFGMGIVDECHTAKAKSLSSIMSKLKEAEYRLGTTGTIGDEHTHKLQLEGMFGPVFKVTTTKTLMDQGHISSLDINVLLLRYSDEECREVVKLDYAAEINFIIEHEKRNKFITNLASDQDGNTLVLFQRVKHGKLLHKMIQEKTREGRKIFYVSGETDIDTREMVRKITETQNDAVIVASLQVFSTGVNIRNLHNVIFAAPSKSQIKILQSIGRSLRISDSGQTAMLFDIADDFHWKSKKNYTLNHAGVRIAVYAKEKFNYNIYEVDFK